MYDLFFASSINPSLIFCIAEGVMFSIPNELRLLLILTVLETPPTNNM